MHIGGNFAAFWELILVPVDRVFGREERSDSFRKVAYFDALASAYRLCGFKGRAVECVLTRVRRSIKLLGVALDGVPLQGS